jgi:hypothetical protein
MKSNDRQLNDHLSFGGLIIMWARCVPGSMIQGWPAKSGFNGKPVLSAVA